MKAIKNRKIATSDLQHPEMFKGWGEEVTSAQIIKSALEYAPSGGVAIPEMRKRFDILQQVESQSKNDEIKLDDVNVELTLDLVRKVPYTVVEKFLLDVEDDIANAQLVKP